MPTDTDSYEDKMLALRKAEPHYSSKGVVRDEPQQSNPREDYKGFKAPRGMSPEQESRWKAAIDRRATEKADELIAGAPDALATKSFGVPGGALPPTTGESEFIKPMKGATGEDVIRRALEVGSVSPVGQIAQAGADVGIAGMDISRGDYPGAAISGAAVLLPFVSAGMLKAAMKPVSESATAASKRLDELESNLAAGKVRESEAKKIGKDIEEQFLADELSVAIDADDFETSSRIIQGSYFDDVVGEISERDMGTLSEYIERQGKNISSMSPDELLKVRDSKKFRDFEIEEIRVANELAKAVDADDFETSSRLIR